MVEEMFNPLDKVFHKFIQNKDSIFKNRNVLNHNYVPKKLLHREKQYKSIFKAMTKGSENDNSFVLCYGKTGTGKTSLILSLLNGITAKCGEIGCKDIITSFINCRLTTTKYRILINLMHQIGLSTPSRYNFNKLFQRFKKEVDSKNYLIILVLDEIDKIFSGSTKKAKNVSNFLISMNKQLKHTKFCIIGISNDLKFKNYIPKKFLLNLHVDLCEFSPYDAIELRNILNERVILGFCSGTISKGILNLIAALSATAGGDARYALSLLQKAGEIAERHSEKSVKEEYVRNVHEILEKNNNNR